MTKTKTKTNKTAKPAKPKDDGLVQCIVTKTGAARNIRTGETKDGKQLTYAKGETFRTTPEQARKLEDANLVVAQD